MAQQLNRVWGMVCEKDRYYYNEKNVDAALAEKDAEIRRLKRALWLARAECAKWKSCYYWYAVSRKYDSRMYDEVERKCRAKAEEYK